MTPEEWASEVFIPMVDVGDRDVSRWEIHYFEARKNIAEAIRAAVLEERGRLGKIKPSEFPFVFNSKCPCCEKKNEHEQGVRYCMFCGSPMSAAIEDV